VHADDRRPVKGNARAKDEPEKSLPGQKDMLNRKKMKASPARGSHPRAKKPVTPAAKSAKPRKRFVLPPAKHKTVSPPPPAPVVVGKSNGHAKLSAKLALKEHAAAAKKENPPGGATPLTNYTTQSGIDLTETINTLLHLAQ